VPNLDDAGFEKYLKQFRPIMPDALPVKEHTRTLWNSSTLPRRIFIAAAMLILSVISVHIINSRIAQRRSDLVLGGVSSPGRPLTLQDANAFLATAPSYKAAVDSMAFHSQGSMIPMDEQSALAVLAKEKIKL